MNSLTAMKVLVLLASTLFFLAFLFLDLSHEFLKKQIRRICAKKLDDPCPRELDYPFFKLTGSASIYSPWRRFSRMEMQIEDRDEFIRQNAPALYDKFIHQERILRLMFGTSFFVLALDALTVAVYLIRHWR